MKDKNIATSLVELKGINAVGLSNMQFALKLYELDHTAVTLEQFNDLYLSFINLKDNGRYGKTDSVTQYQEREIENKVNLLGDWVNGVSVIEDVNTLE